MNSAGIGVCGPARYQTCPLFSGPRGVAASSDIGAMPNDHVPPGRLILQTRAAPRLQLSRGMVRFGQITGFNAHFLDFFVEGVAVNT